MPSPTRHYVLFTMHSPPYQLPPAPPPPPPPELPPEKPLPPDPPGVDVIADEIEDEKLFMLALKAAAWNGIDETYQLFVVVDGMLSRSSNAFAHLSTHSKTIA